MLPIFSQEFFFGANRLLDLGFKRGRNAARFFPGIFFSGQIDS